MPFFYESNFYVVNSYLHVSQIIFKNTKKRRFFYFSFGGNTKFYFLKNQRDFNNFLVDKKNFGNKIPTFAGNGTPKGELHSILISECLQLGYW